MKCMSAMRREAGLSLITAVFLLLVLSALGLYIANISTVEHSTSVLDLQGSRAYHAARAGAEFGAYQAIVANSCPAAVNVALPAGSFADFASVTVSCVSTVHTEGVTAKTLYQITANACNQPAAGVCPNPAPGANYAERELQISVINPP
jgi:MSHA biogenesis protein MshP